MGSGLSAAPAADGPVAISLVICTRNRASQLERCLKTIEQLQCNHPWELVIVDNGSTDATQGVIDSLRNSLPCHVSVRVEPTPGLGRARNLGWRTARGEIVAFTDDDCYPDPSFLRAMLDAFRTNPHLGFLGGQIRLYDPTDYRITIQEHDRRESLPPRSFIQTGLIQGANISFRRAALEDVHGFDEMFGAGALFSCEDIDIVARVSAAGWEGAYDPTPVVYHHHGRKTDAEAARLMKQYDRGRGAYYAKGLLNPVLRVTTLKHWYWSIRFQPYRTTGRELAAACEYWARLGLTVARKMRLAR
ncbi:MAG: glycosyltransferase family 2 protein [Gemmataceae bacterium]